MLEPIPFGGLYALDRAELTPFEAALECTDCYVDDDSVFGRNGYRSVLPSGSSPLPALATTGLAQAIARYRPSPTSARAVCAVAGQIFSIADPSTEALSDGVASSAGTPFGVTAAISMAQLNQHLYIGTDESNVAMRRMKSDFSLETLEAIPQGAKPTAAKGSIAAVVYRTAGLAHTESNGTPASEPVCTLQTSVSGNTLPTSADWFAVMDNAGTGDPASGAWTYFKLAADVDASGMGWILAIVTPNSTNNTNAQVEIMVAKESTPGSGVPGVFQSLGMIYDGPPTGGSPNMRFCSLATLDADIRGKVRFVKYRLAGASGGRFGVYGHVFLPAAPLDSPENYYVTCQNSSTGQESQPTEVVQVTLADGDVVVPTYSDCFIDRGKFATTQGKDDPMAVNNSRNWHLQSNADKSQPVKSDIGLPITIRQTMNSGWIAGEILRLWKDTQNGRRLVTSHTITSGDISTGYVDLVDNGGPTTLANILFKPGGTPPRCNALTARDSRLIAGYENRLYISSFLAPDATSNPFVQFPAIAIEDSDGWAFDIAPSNAEQIQSLVSGDALYILTNEQCRMMRDLSPNARTYTVFDRGALGRRAAIWAENRLFWASWDGIYMAVNQAGADELTKDIRPLYMNTFAPDSTVVLAYKNRKLYAIMGTKMIRYDFVKGRWSGPHTLAHTISHAVTWRDPAGTIQQMWLLTSDRKIGRWQDAATSDMMISAVAGTAIPSWFYGTGFTLKTLRSYQAGSYGETKTRPKFAFVDATANITMTWHKTTGAADFTQAFTSTGEQESAQTPTEGYKWRARFTGANTAILKRAMWERLPTEGRGG